MRQPVVAGPPTPERVRTLAALAAPTHVSITGSALPAGPARGGVDELGRPVLLVKPGEPLHLLAPGDEAVVTVDLSCVRDLGGVARPRGLLKVQGWARAVPGEDARKAAIAIAERCPDEDLFTALERPGEPDAPRLLHIDVGFVVHLTAQETGVLDAEAYNAAEPDPFLHDAERLLHHVNSAHRDTLGPVAARLLGRPVGEVWLWELDRYGVTFREETEETTLIRVPWPSPAANRHTLEHALHRVLCGRTPAAAATYHGGALRRRLERPGDRER
ncbi:prephenate dehydratase [Thermopolyspora flexuosa]|jgi:hypothetical protein|uniref:Uncharacterized protein DUF2470 n=1 Tax=Thermopolyspora flexuosa TaxID=103836 RepID=A0A543IYW8_9ACTN|nr:DUF2470 domain-containing protein [Thermopolyspora flexuosa]TQM75772.1 uncharacterized protein DUF2470 [Thermopolyspora flexuosa]GGM61876.1 prephenate dehydratase [Thermopolyspora flexuosa]